MSANFNLSNRSVLSQERFRSASKYRAAEILGFSSPESLKRYRRDGRLVKNIHWFSINSRRIVYNEDLLIDWVANQSDPEAHQRAIEGYLASLPSNSRKVKKSSSFKNLKSPTAA